jgi:hypothetical protein
MLIRPSVGPGVEYKPSKLFYPLPYMPKNGINYKYLKNDQAYYLKEDDLARYKKRYKFLCGIDLPCDELLIVDNSVIKELQDKSSYQEDNPRFYTELRLAEKLAYLAGQSTYRWDVEVKYGNCRFDAVHWMPYHSKNNTKTKDVIIYELKKDIITYTDILEKILGKRYPKQAKELYGVDCKIIFVAPQGGTLRANLWRRHGVEVWKLCTLVELLESRIDRYSVDSDLKYIYKA